MSEDTVAPQEPLPEGLLDAWREIKAADNVHQFQPSTSTPWEGFFPGDSFGRPAEREWLVPDLIPADEVVLLTGAPGAAKSKLLLQLQICAAIGETQWIGRDVVQCRGLGLYLGEDDRAEQERRCWDICAALGKDISLLGDQLELNPQYSAQKWLSTKIIEDGVRWSDLGRELWRIVRNEYYRLIVIDTATKALGWLGKRDGDWVDHVIQMLRQQCIENHCTIVLTDHSNKTDRKGFSGVNSLLAAVRAAMNIYVPTNGDHIPLRDKRVLHELRSSYSTWEPIRLKWQDAILVVDDSADEEIGLGVSMRGEVGLETDKAFQFYDGHKTVWLPKARVQWDEATRTMRMPSWLAEKFGQ